MRWSGEGKGLDFELRAHTKADGEEKWKSHCNEWRCRKNENLSFPTIPSRRRRSTSSLNSASE